jgi:hypothetical protein
MRCYQFDGLWQENFPQVGAMMNMNGGSGAFTQVEARKQRDTMTGMNGERMAAYARRGRVLI